MILLIFFRKNWLLLLLICAEIAITYIRNIFGNEYPEPLGTDQRWEIATIYVFLYTIIIGPAIEEFAFRKWLKIKFNFVWFCSLLLCALYCYFSFSVVGFLASIIVLLLAIIFYKKFWALTLLSSSLFSFIHFESFSFTTVAILYWLDLFISGILFAYIYWRWNIWACIAAHMLMNIWALFDWNGTQLVWQQKKRRYQSAQATGEVITHAITEPYHMPNFQVDKKKKVWLQHVLPNEVYEMVWVNTHNVVYLYYGSENIYSIKLQATTTWHNDSIWKSELKKIFPVNSDTMMVAKRPTYKIVYTAVTDTAQLSANKQRWNATGTVSSIATRLSQMYRIPITSDDTAKVRVPLSSTRSFKETKALLEKQYGFKFIEEVKPVHYIFISTP